MEYKIVNSSEFNRFLNQGGQIQNLRIFEEIEISNRGFKIIKLSNCIFEEPVNLIKSNFFEDIEFENCEFKQDIFFKEVGFYKHFIFKNCTANKCVNFINVSFNKFDIENLVCDQIIFKGDIKSIENEEGAIHFKSGNLNDINFSSKEINCSIKLSSAKIKDLSFTSTNIYQSISFDSNLEIDNLSIESTNLYDRLDFHECLIRETTYLHKSNFYEQVVFSKDCSNSRLTLANVYAKYNFSINYNLNVESLDISDCTFDSNLSLYCYKEDIDYESKGFMCNISGIIHGNAVFENVPMTHLSIGGVNFGNLTFNRIRTKLIFLQDFYNNNKLTISNIILDKNYNLLLIYDSNINDTEFINVNFKKFDEVVIAKSNVSNILLSNSLFPLKITTETKAPNFGYKIENHENIDKYMYYRETYRQLKLAMEKQGNRNVALQYKAKEMHFLRKELKFGWDKILLYLNYLSNNHGTSWIRGIAFTITVGFIFFCIYNSTLSVQYFYWNLNSTLSDTKEAFLIGLNQFFSFLTSFPKLRLDDNSNTWQTNLSVLMSRIFIGYGIYQTIISFRKYGGK